MKTFLILTKNFLLKYFKWVLAFGFFAYVILFGSYNFIDNWQLSREIKGKEELKQSLEQDIANTRQNLDLVNSRNKENVERQAREQHLMHQTNEDVFVVPEKP